MEKPNTLTMKEWLIRKMAVKLMMSEKIIETIINHQFLSAQEAMPLTNTVEISGFGKFIFNHKKAFKELEKEYSKEKKFLSMLEEDHSEQKKQSIQNKLTNTYKTINQLRPQLNRYELYTSDRGLEKQTNSSCPSETID